MINKSEDMEVAIRHIISFYGLKRVIIGIENNKKAAIESMRRLAERVGNMEIKVLPSIYPQGGEKVLIYHTTGKVVPLGKLPADVGCIVCNCTTLAAIGNYIKTGMPLVSKCVTVDGGAVKEPKNVIAPIGTPISELFDFCGGLTRSPEKILYGGPMMGISVPDTTVPVLKNTNAVLALIEDETKPPKQTACIRCGSCANTCPFGINPAEIARAYEKGDLESAEKIGVNLCMECGCCSFVCPAVRPLVQINKLTKAALRDAKSKEESKK
jgi:electron transport complex protein RnfC